MIHLAKQDIKHTLGKFIVTAMGVGMLLGIVLIMMGVYRGMIVDAEALLNDLNVDLWVVQENTLGPFAEASRVHEDLKYTIKALQGIDKTEAITFQNIQLPRRDKKVRVLAVGYDVYGDISPINPAGLVCGRSLTRDHYEIVVTDKTGFHLNDKIQLGRNIYTVVGLTHGSVSSGGELLVYISLKDAQKLQFSYSNKRIQTDRARGINNKDTLMVNAVIATIKPGYNVDKIAGNIRQWYHKGVYTRDQQKAVLTKYVVEKASRQIGLFTAILVIVATIIISLIIYTMTLEKMKEISIMKLIGLPNTMIVRMIVEETLLLGILAFLFGNLFSHIIYSRFPKRVVLQISDAWILFAVVVIASIFASFVGVKKVINADPTAAIGGKMHNKTAIKVENLYKSFGHGDSFIEVIKNASFTINKGELVALIAPSGGGKTTLLMMIGCVAEPSSGKIWIGTEKVFDNKWLTNETRKIRREKIGFIFQAHYLIPFLNIMDNLTLLPQANHIDEKISRKKAQELLKYFGIADKEKLMPSQLSGGQNQRVAIARALANNPQIILADEPTAALDIERSVDVVKMLKKIAMDQEVAIVMVTHDDRMLPYCDRIMKIENKAIVFE